jgi:hypothetical protein
MDRGRRLLSIVLYFLPLNPFPEPMLMMIIDDGTMMMMITASASSILHVGVPPVSSHIIRLQSVGGDVARNHCSISLSLWLLTQCPA